jgi:hypothetical protein
LDDFDFVFLLLSILLVPGVILLNLLLLLERLLLFDFSFLVFCDLIRELVFVRELVLGIEVVTGVYNLGSRDFIILFGLNPDSINLLNKPFIWCKSSSKVLRLICVVDVLYK